ncbi:MAG: metalloregulator ArsR/SmtB family transcription factor [candidate division WWE3 bacterium]|nr:metalloregulator ArsR/SmtB family transcription factor [candidate division WWE3 bacterium]
MSSTKLNPQCTECFKELGASSKVKIVSALLKNKKPMTVNEFVKLLKLRQPTVSFHLRTLREVGLLTSEKKGRFVYYSLDPKCEKNGKKCFLF